MLPWFFYAGGGVGALFLLGASLYYARSAGAPAPAAGGAPEQDDDHPQEYRSPEQETSNRNTPQVNKQYLMLMGTRNKSTPAPAAGTSRVELKKSGLVGQQFRARQRQRLNIGNNMEMDLVDHKLKQEDAASPGAVSSAGLGAITPGTIIKAWR